MRYFNQQGKNDHEVIKALNAKFGDNYHILSRKTVKLGGIMGVGRRNGVQYFGYILEKTTAIAGNKNKKKYEQNKYSQQSSEYFPVSEQDSAERDQHNRNEILARFANNTEVQRLLKEGKLSLNSGKSSSQEVLPPAPHLPISKYRDSDEPRPKSPIQFSTKEEPTQTRNPGFTSIYDPARKTSKQYVENPDSQKIQNPEYTNENYDVLGAHSERSIKETQNDYFLPSSERYQQQNAAQNHSQIYEPQRTNRPRPSTFDTLPNEHNREHNHRKEYDYPSDHPINYRQQYSEHHNGYGNEGSNRSNHFPSDYSSDPSSTYQRNLDQVEAKVLQRIDHLELKLNRKGGLSEPASLGALRESMYCNEFPPLFVDRLVSQMKRELSLESLENLQILWEYVLLHIAENMRFTNLQNRNHSRIMVLIGPTGVGKTTTIAKIAARQCVKAMGGSRKVHLITLDNYRIGAQDQIRTYGEILEARVDCVETTEGLGTCIEQDQDSDMILIDTMGRSPGDYIKLAELRQFLQYSGNCEIHLTMSATSGASALKQIITQFKPFGFCSVILTKLDELGCIGGVLGTFLQEDIPLSYVTTGQNVPHDIRPASALILLQQLTDVQVDWHSFAQKLE